MSHVLEVLPVPAAQPAAILPDLAQALAGERSLLPIPAADPTRAGLLQTSQRAGQNIAADVALVVGTSGSTGTPKGAQLTATNLLASATATHQHLGGPGRWLLAMPAHHIAGLQVLIRSLVASTEPVCLDVTGGFSIPDFVTAARALQADGQRAYTSLTPMQLAKALDHLAGIEALQGFAAILVGGAAANPQLLAAARGLDIAVITTYGSSETAGGCVYDGRPLPGAQVRLADGRIHLGGPMIAAGYRNLPDHPAFAEPGWFATSDGGRLDDGILTVTGRLDTVIDSGGLKLHPEVLEREILRTPGVTGVCVVGIPHPRLGQAIVAAYSGTATRGDILDNLYELPRWQIPKEVLRVEALPTTALGKIDRAAVARLFAG